MNDFKDYANSFQEKSALGLDMIGALLEKVGNPHKNMRFVHIAGTNGKGSVCAFLQSIFTASGLKTGKYTSPNMIDVCERISIDGKNIKNEDMEKLLLTLEKASEEIRLEKGALPTQFEIWTAAAFMYFKKRKCDIVVLETGLGGRLDATNIIEAPVCSVITRIGIDHTAYLGNTIEKIAREKAGIIKKGGKTVTLYDQNGLDVIENRAIELKNRLYLTKKAENRTHTGGSEIFDYKDYKALRLNLAGEHQIENAALAIEAAELLGIGKPYIQKGLR